MKMLEILRAREQELLTERASTLDLLDSIPAKAIEEERSLTDEEKAAFDEARAKIGSEDAEAPGIDSQLDTVRSEIADLEKITERKENSHRKAPVPGMAPAVSDLDVRSLNTVEARDAALRVLEGEQRELAPFQLDHVSKVLRTRNGDTDGDQIARQMLLTSTPEYRSAFMKLMTQTTPILSPEEGRAINAFNEFRAASHTSAAGGYGVPVLIDPTIILTSGAADAPILRYARIETITTDIWKGVSSAAASWAVVAEGAASTDAMPTLAQPQVTTYTARSFLPFSVEIDMDYPSFEQEMKALLGQGYTDYLAAKTITGSGSDIQGVYTALDANASSEVTVTTDGQLGAVDFRKLWAALPERYHQRATWVMSVSVENQARSFSTSGMGSDFTVTMLDGGIPAIFNRPVITTDYAPSFTGTTGAANIAVLMDLSNYVIAQRAGMTVELVPHLFDVTNNMPTLSRGWLAYARTGGDSVNDNGGRILQNT